MVSKISGKEYVSDFLFWQGYFLSLLSEAAILDDQAEGFQETDSGGLFFKEDESFFVSKKM